jgi:hypothetical protein
MWIQPQAVLDMCKCAMQHLNPLWNEVIFLQHQICIMKSLNLAVTFDSGKCGILYLQSPRFT